MGATSYLTLDSQRSMEWASWVGQCLNLFPCARSHTELGEQEFCDKVLLRYQVHPKELPEKFHRCTTNKPFTLQNLFRWKLGGLVTVHHNKVWDSLALMGLQDFLSYSVCDKPLVCSRRVRTGTKHSEVTINSTSEQAVGLYKYLHIQIHHMRQHQTDTIIDFKVTDTDKKYYISHPLDNVM